MVMAIAVLDQILRAYKSGTSDDLMESNDINWRRYQSHAVMHYTFKIHIVKIRSSQS